MIIEVPARGNVPATKLFVKIVLGDGAKELGNRKTMILIPGGPGGNHQVYNEIVDNLKQYADLVLIDPRGCGQSEVSEAIYCTMNHEVDDIEVVREQLKLDKPIILGGSYGAMVALGYAINYPNNLSTLILLAGAPSGSFIEKAKANLKIKGTPEQIVMGNKLFSGKIESAKEMHKFYKIMAPLYVFRATQKDEKAITSTSDELPTIKNDTAYPVHITNYGYRFFLPKFDYSHSLNQIKVKTLILSGDEDWINDPSFAQIMAKSIPDCSYHLFKKCGHIIWRDVPDEFSEAIDSFFKP